MPQPLRLSIFTTSSHRIPPTAHIIPEDSESSRQLLKRQPQHSIRRRAAILREPSHSASTQPHFSQNNTMPPSTTSATSSAATKAGVKGPVKTPCWCGDDCQCCLIPCVSVFLHQQPQTYRSIRQTNTRDKDCHVEIKQSTNRCLRMLDLPFMRALLAGPKRMWFMMNI